jgi:CRISPR-associated protein Csb2
MPTLLLSFPGRRYHATPWGHHVNEGIIEWPPSPWRLLRALLSTGYATLGWGGNVCKPMQCSPPPDARSLILKLSGVLPRYRLPAGAGAHSRHYMPLAALKAPGAKADKSFVLAHQATSSPIVHGYKEDTTLVFDTWAQVDDGELAVTWDVELSDIETNMLAQLAAHLGYLGRSESWVLARLAGAGDWLPLGSDCLPCDSHPLPGPGWEQVPLMAPLSVDAYTEWRQDTVAEALAPYPVPEGKKPPKKLLDQRAKAEAPYPADVIACLQADTNWLRSYGWSQPPGSQRVFYWRKSDALEVGAPKPRQQTLTAPPVEAMLLSMTTASRNDHALPPVMRILPQAELLHRALVSFVTMQSGHSRVLSGCDEAGTPLRGSHEHAHILPLDLDGDGHLEHILIWAPMGLDAEAQAAVRAVRRTFTKGGIGPLRLALEGGGALDQLRDLPGVYGEGLRAVLGPSEGATTWASITPFVPPRFLKKRGRNTLEGQVADELASRGHPAPLEVQLLDPHDHERARRQRHFIRSRRHGPSASIDCGFTLTLGFAEPVRGPLCLGYGSHFGLGMFAQA